MQRSAHPARNHALAVAAGGTLILELLMLVFVEKVFVGGWLGDHALLGLGERLGLVGAMILYSLALPGAVLAIGVPLLRLARMRAERAAWTVALGWLLIIVILAVVQTRVGEFFKGALDLDLIRGLGGGSILGAVKYILTWFWLEALLGLGGLIGGIWLCLRLSRWLRTVPFESTRLGQVRSRWIRGTVGVAVIFVILDVTVMGLWWPSVAWATGRSFVGSFARTVVAEATDFDRDGVGAFDEPADQAPFDSSRHPYAVDVPDDGIDTDGLLGDLRREDLPEVLLRATDARMEDPGPPRPGRNVIVAFLESFRADLVGAVENGRPVTPVLCDLIERGEALHVEPALACIGYTAPAIRQAFWGGHVRRGPTLLHDLKTAGFFCATVSGQEENWNSIDSDTGLVDCDFYEDPRQDDPEHVRGGIRRIDRVLMSFDRFLAARPQDRPFFVYMNLQDCHFPYGNAYEKILYTDLPENPSLGKSNADVLWRLFVNQAANVDRGIGALRDRLVRAGVWDDTILVLVSDHGESIYHDDVLGHGLRLTDNQTRLACVVVHPTTDIVAPYTHTDMRGLVRSMLAVATPVPHPAVRTPPGRRVLQVLGTMKKPRRLAHVDATGYRVIYDLGRRLCLEPSTGRTCSLDSDRAEDRDLVQAARDLIRHWEYERWLMEVP